MTSLSAVAPERYAPIGAVDAARRIRSGQMSASELVEKCIKRIDELDGQLDAWAYVDRDGAREAAEDLDADFRGGIIRGPLHGIPVGVKDVIDVGGMPTHAGARAFAHYLATKDATVVSRLRSSGAILLGKTTTTQFAYGDPATTRNPWNLAHSPGGSSSGSAAAVASGMVPVALGTQTVGSTLRPAGYCGVVGFKGTHGLLSCSGVIPVSWHLDHVGIITRSVADAALVVRVAAAKDDSDPFSIESKPIDYVTAVESGLESPRFGVPISFFSERSSTQVMQHFQAIADLLTKSGAVLEDVDFAPSSEWAAGGLVLRSEAATYHARSFQQHSDDYAPRIRSTIEAGLAVSAKDYVEAQRSRWELRRRTILTLAKLDAYILPVAPTTAPVGFATTGDATFCGPATYSGLPSITVPTGISDDGLPFGTQLICRPEAEEQLFRLASWLERLSGGDSKWAE